jgi:hypothetical protein
VAGGGVSQGVFTGGNPIGAGLIVHSLQKAPVRAVALFEAFKAIGLPIGAIEDSKLPEDEVGSW